MKRSEVLAGLSAGIIAGVFARARAKGEDMSDAYSGLRTMALGMTPKMLGQTGDFPENRPYAVVADISIDSGFATVVAGAGGQASIYTSGGGGYIGGEGIPNVNAAAKAAVEAAKAALAEMHPTKDYPLPTQGNVNFYALTTAGVMTATSPESAVRDASQPLGRLYAAVQDVITQYRLSQS